MIASDDFFKTAMDEASGSVRNNLGGPFGAVVVKDGKVIGKGGNRVSSSNDPTAHAEIVAIRDACSVIGSFDLSGCILYTTCEPCPMCLSAIYWANIAKVFYGATRYDAADIGFKDNHIYEELPLEPANRKIPFIRVDLEPALQLFREWTEKTDKIPY